MQIPSKQAVRCSAVALMCVLALSASRGMIAQTQPDNSANNKNHVTTADTQSNSKADRETTAKVRKAIIADKGLSTYAHNVKIITINGMVTLKGPVKTEEEKQKVAQDAASAVSADSVTNQLSVKQ